MINFVNKLEVKILCDCYTTKPLHKKFNVIPFYLISCGKTLKDKVSNNFCKMSGVESIDEFLQGQRLQWLGHVKRVGKEKGPAKALHFKFDSTKKADWRRDGKR